MVRDASPQMVAGCKFLGMLQGSSGWGGAAASDVGAQNARNEVRDEAASLGATHVVWRSLSGGLGGGRAEGEAYSCPAPR
jgi:hypothetical protein